MRVIRTFAPPHGCCRHGMDPRVKPEDDECNDDYGESQTSTIRSNALSFVILGLDPSIHAVTNVPPMTVQA